MDKYKEMIEKFVLSAIILANKFEVVVGMGSMGGFQPTIGKWYDYKNYDIDEPQWRRLLNTAEKLENEFGDLFVYERDGSIGYGLEIISSPMTKDIMKKYQ